MSLRKMLCLLLAVLLVLPVLHGCKNMDLSTETQVPTDATETLPTRQVREGIQTVLICCTEPYDPAEDSGGFRNANRANFMMLMVIDEKTGTITPVQMNPDLQVSFGIPGKPGKTDMTVGDVCSYGSGGSDSALYLLDAASDLLGDVRIDHYLSFTMNAVAMATDSIGGVSVPASDYFADISGDETVLLSGSDAMAYFAFRDSADAENTERMERQRGYMRAFYGPFLAKAQNEDFLSDLLLRLGDNMATDLTLSQLILMFETFAAYALTENIVTLPQVAGGEGESTCIFADADGVWALMEPLIFE